MRAETSTLRYLKKTPSYKHTAQDGTLVAQHHYTGHTHAIVYFLQSVHNPRCRQYCQELGRQAAKARAYKTVIIAIAPEPVEVLAREYPELQLPFPLLSDSELESFTRYGLVKRRWFRALQLLPALVVHDKYGIVYYLAVPENDQERPPWEEIEAVLERFPRG